MNGNYGWGLPIQASTFAKDVDRGIFLLHTSMITIFIVWGIFFAFLLVKYRARPGHRAESSKGKIWWLLLPLALVFTDEIYMITAYAIPTWSKIVIQQPDENAANVLEVIGEQYAWNIHYPGADGKFGKKDPRFIDSSNILGLDQEDPASKDDVVTLNELRIPLGKPTLVYLSSKDVIHSFFIPEFRIKKDATPGMRAPLWFEPTRAGKYELVCSQLCGIGHTTMRADVIVENPQEYALWLKNQQIQKD